MQLNEIQSLETCVHRHRDTETQRHSDTDLNSQREEGREGEREGGREGGRTRPQQVVLGRKRRNLGLGFRV